MARDATHHDPRTWMKLADGKPLMRSIPCRFLNKAVALKYGTAKEMSRAITDSGCSVTEGAISGWINGTGARMSDKRVMWIADAMSANPIDVLGMHVSTIAPQTVRKTLFYAIEGLRRWQAGEGVPGDEITTMVNCCEYVSPWLVYDIGLVKTPDDFKKLVIRMPGDWRDLDALARTALDHYLTQAPSTGLDMLGAITTTGRECIRRQQEDF